jgi:hypothetical protein
MIGILGKITTKANKLESPMTSEEFALLSTKDKYFPSRNQFNAIDCYEEHRLKNEFDDLLQQFKGLAKKRESELSILHVEYALDLYNVWQLIDIKQYTTLDKTKKHAYAAHSLQLSAPISLSSSVIASVKPQARRRKKNPPPAAIPPPPPPPPPKFSAFAVKLAKGAIDNFIVNPEPLKMS